MKKILLLFTLFSIFSFSNYELENKILKEKLDIVQNFKNGNSVVADVFSADTHIDFLTSKKDNNLGELLLILPNVELLNKKLDKLSKQTKNTYIFLYANPTDKKYLSNRTYATFEKLNLDKEIKKYPNIYVFKISNKSEDTILEDTFKGLETRYIFKEVVDIYNIFGQNMNIREQLNGFLKN